MLGCSSAISVAPEVVSLTIAVDDATDTEERLQIPVPVPTSRTRNGFSKSSGASCSLSPMILVCSTWVRSRRSSSCYVRGQHRNLTDCIGQLVTNLVVRHDVGCAQPSVSNHRGCSSIHERLTSTAKRMVSSTMLERVINDTRRQ